MTPFSFITHRRGLKVWVHVLKKTDSGLLETVHTSWSLTQRLADREGRDCVHRFTRSWRRRQPWDAVYRYRGRQAGPVARHGR